MSKFVDDRVFAVELLRDWLEVEGFALQTTDRSDGYWVTGTSKCARQVISDAYHRAVVRYRGGGSGAVQSKLEAVSDRLDALGVKNEWERPELAPFPMLVVTVLPFAFDEEPGRALPTVSDRVNADTGGGD